jgi:hypothetical protein
MRVEGQIFGYPAVTVAEVMVEVRPTPNAEPIRVRVPARFARQRCANYLDPLHLELDYGPVVDAIAEKQSAGEWR